MSILGPPTPRDRPLLSDERRRAFACQWKPSARELDILPYLAKDEKESTIAHRLRISANTVQKHLHRLYQKLGVSGRLDVIVLIFREYIAHEQA